MTLRAGSGLSLRIPSKSALELEHTQTNEVLLKHSPSNSLSREAVGMQHRTFHEHQNWTIKLPTGNRE